MDSERTPFDPDALIEDGVLHAFGPIDLPDGRRAELWLLDTHDEEWGDEMEWIARIKSCAHGLRPPRLTPLDIASMRRQRKGVLNASTIEDFLRSHGLFQPAIVAKLVDLAIGRAECDDDRVGAYNALAELAVAWEGSGWVNPFSHSGVGILGPYSQSVFANEDSPGSGKWTLLWTSRDGQLQRDAFTHPGGIESLGAAIATAYGFDE